MALDIFESSVRQLGDLAGVFEYCNDVGYFYLYEMSGEAGRKILDSILVVSGEIDFMEQHVSVRWDTSDRKVGLFIKEDLWAVFDTHLRVKYGRRYGEDSARFPREIMEGF